MPKVRLLDLKAGGLPLPDSDLLQCWFPEHATWDPQIYIACPEHQCTIMNVPNYITLAVARTGLSIRGKKPKEEVS